MDSSQDNYSKNGMQTKVWGPTGWVFLHSIAQNYPEEPTNEQKMYYKNFFRLIGNVLPCRYCRESYQQFIEEPGTKLNDAVMKNRKTFTRWLYDIHNKVNKKLGINYCVSFEQVTKKYESFRSKCTKSEPVTKPIKGCTNASSEDSLRKKCEIIFFDIDEHGNKLKEFSFGKTKGGIKLISIKRSNKSDKKFMATFETNGRQKVIHFGASGASDFIKHHDRERRNRYIFRHHKDLKTGNPARAGYLSMFVLWNKPSLQASIADYRRRLNVYNRTGKFPTNITGYTSPGKKSKYQ
jgi:hypothetical protein